MTDFKCKNCNEVVVKGEIKEVDTKSSRKAKLLLDDQMKGALLRNKSRDPHKWEFECSRCQGIKAKSDSK